jgi:Chromo (CHRromatin Organisation MOdifier) domain
MEALGIKRKLSTAFHPETDGQTERVNQSIEQYLRSFCNYDQNDWFELLPLAEYAYNNSMTTATGMSPFYANYGYNPRTRWLQQAELKNPAAEMYVHWMEEVHQHCKEQLEKTRDKMSKYFDPKRTPAPPFKIGDKVMLDGRNLKTKRSSKKLDHKMHGEFTITKLIGTHAVQLQLPKTMKCHNVFHVSLLEPYRASTIKGRQQSPPSPVIIDGMEEYEVERILWSEKRKAKRGKKWWVEYLVKWKGYPLGESSWETINAFQGGADHFVHRFHLDNPEAPKDPSLK